MDRKLRSERAPESITEKLGRWAEGDKQAFDELFPLVMDELHELASRHFARESSCATLQPTALVHEAYLRMVASDIRGFETRRSFFAFASRLIRQILVDHARARISEKRGGRIEKRSLELGDDTAIGSALGMADILTVHRSLERLAKVDITQARIAELRYFAGLTVSEVAETLRVSTATVERSWRLARRRLALEMNRRRRSMLTLGPKDMGPEDMGPKNRQSEAR